MKKKKVKMNKGILTLSQRIDIEFDYRLGVSISKIAKRLVKIDQQFTERLEINLEKVEIDCVIFLDVAIIFLYSIFQFFLFSSNVVQHQKNLALINTRPQQLNFLLVQT